MTIKIGDKEYDREELLNEFKERAKDDIPFAFIAETACENKIDLRKFAKFVVIFCAAQLLINFTDILIVNKTNTKITQLETKVQQLEDEVNMHKSIDSLSTDIDNLWDYIINLQECGEWDVQDGKPVLKQETTDKAKEA